MHAMLQTIPTEALVQVADCLGWPRALTLYCLCAADRPREALFAKLDAAARRRWTPTLALGRSPSLTLQHFWLTSGLADLRRLNDAPPLDLSNANRGVRFVVRNVFGRWEPLPPQATTLTTPQWSTLTEDAQWLSLVGTQQRWYRMVRNTLAPYYYDQIGVRLFVEDFEVDISRETVHALLPKIAFPFPEFPHPSQEGPQWFYLPASVRGASTPSR